MSGDTLFTALKLNLCYFPHAALVWNRKEGKKKQKKASYNYPTVYNHGL